MLYGHRLDFDRTARRQPAITVNSAIFVLPSFEEMLRDKVVIAWRVRHLVELSSTGSTRPELLSKSGGLM